MLTIILVINMMVVILLTGTGKMPAESHANTALPELFQMRYSMFPEMARWALDFKGVPHIRQSVLPGPHAPKIKRLAGQTCMPVLRHEGELIRNSDKVLDAVEQHWPEPSLYPVDTAERQQAVEIRDRFRRWGPHFRRALFYALLTDSDYAAELFSQGYSDAERRRYRRFFPAVKVLMRLSMGVSSRRSQQSLEVVAEAMDWLSASVNEHGYLVGSQFSVADLTAATVVILTRLTEDTSAAAAEPRPPQLQAWVDCWAGHPAADWAEKMYRHHRPASAAADDRNY